MNIPQDILPKELLPSRGILAENEISVFYLVVILLGSVWLFSRANTVLTDNYTLHIRWDYMVYFFTNLPLPVLLFLRLLKPIRSSIMTIDGNIEIMIAFTVFGFEDQFSS